MDRAESSRILNQKVLQTNVHTLLLSSEKNVDSECSQTLTVCVSIPISPLIFLKDPGGHLRQKQMCRKRLPSTSQLDRAYEQKDLEGKA